jgi:hypothetical protein
MQAGLNRTLRPLILLLALTIAGCAVPPVEPSPNPNWTRVSGKEAGCVSYGPRHREPVDLNIILKPEFEETLSAQLDAGDRNASKCWYETPSGTIRLFTGDFCGEGTDTFFEQEASVWKLARTVPIFASCHPTKG